MNDFLFGAGVVGDASDQPRQHQPRPVQNLEDELSPVRDNRRRCADCGLLSPSARPDLCTPCSRERQMRKRNAAMKRRHSDRAAESQVLERIRERGSVVVNRINRHIVERLIVAGSVRLMSALEQQRAGLQRFDAVAVLRRSEQG